MEARTGTSPLLGRGVTGEGQGVRGGSVVGGVDVYQEGSESTPGMQTSRGDCQGPPTGKGSRTGVGTTRPPPFNRRLPPKEH